MEIGEDNMYLQDIDLDIPYKVKTEIVKNIMNEQGCSYEQGIQKDYEENWKWNVRRRFTLETRCISSMVLRLMGKIKTEDCSKILINCVDEEAKDGISSCMGIYTLEYLLNYDNFFLKSDYEKKVITLNIIKECVNKIVYHKGWNYEPFKIVFNRIVELEYNNSWTWGKKVRSPDKIKKAEVYIEHQVKKVNIYIYIRNKKNEIIKKKLILKEVPHEFSYARHLGKLVWISENELQLNNKKGDKVGTVIL